MDSQKHLPMREALRKKLEGSISWREYGQLTASASVSNHDGHLDDHSNIIHLGSRAHEQWSVQKLVSAVVSSETSVEEAVSAGLERRQVMCWHYEYWRAVPDSRKTANRVLCFFYHHAFDGIDDPQVIAGVCMNAAVANILRKRRPDKPIYLVDVGGSEDAIPYARRRHWFPGTRLLICGNAHARLRMNHGQGSLTNRSRKGTELVVPLATCLDPRCYGWLFLGVGWDSYVEELERLGFVVIHPGPLESPNHYEYFGEGDIYLMLSQLEGGPLTLLEAMGVGIWPICTSTGIAVDILSHVPYGNLVGVYTGSNAANVVANVAQCIHSVDRDARQRSKPQIQASVADRTWARFGSQMRGILECTFGK